MIYRVEEANWADFSKACGYERVFGSKCMAALLAYGAESDTASLWVGYHSPGEPSAALYLAGGVLVVSSDNRIPVDEMAQFVREQRVTEVDTNWEQCAALQKVLGGAVESSWYMAYEGGPIEGDFSGIVGKPELRDVFDVLLQSHEYYRNHYQYEPWATDIHLKTGKGLMEVYLLTVDGRPAGTGSIVSEDDLVGAIAAVAVAPEYRGKGYGTLISQFLVNRILHKKKTPVLISGYDEVAELYRRVGFHETGRWGELYL